MPIHGHPYAEFLDEKNLDSLKLYPNFCNYTFVCNLDFILQDFPFKEALIPIEQIKDRRPEIVSGSATRIDTDDRHIVEMLLILNLGSYHHVLQYIDHRILQHDMPFLELRLMDIKTPFQGEKINAS